MNPASLSADPGRIPVPGTAPPETPDMTDGPRDYAHAGLIDNMDAHAGKHTVRPRCPKSELFRCVFMRDRELTCLPL